MVDIGIIKIGHIPVNIFLVISRLQIISKKEVEIENQFGTKADLSDYKTSDIIVVQSKKKHKMICILKYKSYRPIKKMGYRKYQYIRGFYE